MAKKKKTNGSIRRMEKQLAEKNLAKARAVKAKPQPKKLTRRELEALAEAKAKRTKLILIISAIVALVGIVAGLLIYLIGGYVSTRRVDYTNDNLSKYITLSDGDLYYDVELAVDEVTDLQVEQAVLQLLCKNKDKVATEVGKTNRTVTPGDVVYVWYMGYQLDGEGNKIAFNGGCNFGDGAAHELEIGSGSFITGFELGLIGRNPADHSSFVRLYSGEVKEGDLIRVKYTAMYPDGTTALNKTVNVDLGSTAANEVFGENYLEYFLGDPEDTESAPKQAGVDIEAPFLIPNYKGEGGTATITDIKIEQIYRLGDSPITLALAFPKSYGEPTLAGEDVFFDVYIEGADLYDCPEYNDEFISETLKLTAEDLAEYEGQTLADKYLAKIREELDLRYEEDMKYAIQNAMWEHYLTKVKVKRLPKAEVNAAYNSYLADMQTNFNASGYMSYETFDEYATAYLGISDAKTSWQQALTLQAESSVVEKLILFYLMQKLDILPAEEDFIAARDEMIDKYLQSYLAQTTVTPDKYDTEEKYLAAVENCRQQVIKSYGMDYFEESAYFELAFDTLVGYANILE